MIILGCLGPYPLYVGSVGFSQRSHMICTGFPELFHDTQPAEPSGPLGLLLPREAAVPFGPEEAAWAARLYSEIARARGREIDLAIAAGALVHHARLWTLNVEDFKDIPGLEMFLPE